MSQFVVETQADDVAGLDSLVSPDEFKGNVAATPSSHTEDENLEKMVSDQPSAESEPSSQKAVPAPTIAEQPQNGDLNQTKRGSDVDGDEDKTSQPGIDIDAKIAKRASKRQMITELYQIIHDDESDDSNDDEHLLDSLSKDLEQRMPKARRRMYQNFLYHNLVNDRLRYLERSIKELQKGEEPVDPKGTRETLTPHVPSIRYLTWKEFETKPHVAEDPKHFKHGVSADSSPQSVLEVLIEEPHVNARSRRHRRSGGLDGFKLDANESGHVHDSKSLKPDNVVVNGPRLPLRLRVRSPALVKLLTKFTPERSFGSYDKVTTTFLQPFKLLIAKSQEIKETLEQLENECRATSKGSKTLDPAADDQAKEDIPLSEPVLNEEGQRIAQPKASQDSGGQESQAKLRSSVNEAKSDETLGHLRILVKFIDEDLGYIWDLRQRLLEKSLRKIAFVDLWHLFDYGQEVRTPGNKNLQLYRVIKFTGGREFLNWRDPPDTGTPAEQYDDYVQGAFYIQCFHLDFNGTHYGPTDTVFVIRRYEGERDINTLAVFPLACDPKEPEIRQQLLNRGTEFAKLSSSASTAQRHKIYSGLTVDRQQEQVDSQVLIDFQWAFLKNPTWRPELGFSNTFEHDGRENTMHSADLGTCGREGCCGNDQFHGDYIIDNDAYEKSQRENRGVWDSIDSADELSDDDKVLLPYRAYGFVLRSRKWATFAIDLLKEVTYSDGWKNLELPPGHKQTVLALVQNHTGGSAIALNHEDAFATMDLVRGKGKGLIVLLHGEPGVGKTSTAECVADHTKRPLFPITCGDIGDNAEKVEQNLEDNFQLAHRWGCVLLLDEADVFLQKRDKTDLARNSIVSVFLRTLEYYSGILFLTTNRVGNIDQAFKSRLHLSLFYPRLSRSTTVAIWKNHLSRTSQRFKEERKKFIIEKQDIINFAREHYRELKEKRKLAPWNGRQIRNAFQTAIALAEYRAQQSGETPRLDREQFEKVAETSLQFDLYLKSVYKGRTDADIAAQDQVRISDFSAENMERARRIPMEMNSSPSPALPTKSAMKKPLQQPEGSDSDHPSDDDLDSDDVESEAGSDERKGESDDERTAEPEAPPERVRRKSATVLGRDDPMSSNTPSSKSKR